MKYRSAYGLKIQPQELLGGHSPEEAATLLDVSEVLEYKDNKKTDNVIGYYYTIVCPDGVLLRVKILGKRLIEPDLLVTKPKVCFIGLEGKIYISNQRLALSCSATDIEIVL